jgi:hypothetical protein
LEKADSLLPGNSTSGTERRDALVTQGKSELQTLLAGKAFDCLPIPLPKLVRD